MGCLIDLIHGRKKRESHFVRSFLTLAYPGVCRPHSPPPPPIFSSVRMHKFVDASLSAVYRLLCAGQPLKCFSCRRTVCGFFPGLPGRLLSTAPLLSPPSHTNPTFRTNTFVTPRPPWIDTHPCAKNADRERHVFVGLSLSLFPLSFSVVPWCRRRLHTIL